jgi:hypothetical protein
MKAFLELTDGRMIMSPGFKRFMNIYDASVCTGCPNEPTCIDGDTCTAAAIKLKQGRTMGRAEVAAINHCAQVFERREDE